MLLGLVIAQLILWCVTGLIQNKKSVRRIKTQVIMAIKHACDEADINIPYPIRTVYHFDQQKYQDNAPQDNFSQDNAFQDNAFQDNAFQDNATQDHATQDGVPIESSAKSPINR